MSAIYTPPLRPDELMHYGVLGMHWGIRRYQPYPKNYTGDGRAVGEARRVQDKIRNATDTNSSFGSYRNYKEINDITSIGNKKDVKDARKEYDAARAIAEKASDAYSKKISKNMYDKNGKANPNSPVIQFYRSRGHNIETDSDGHDREEDSYFYLMSNLDKHPSIKKKWDKAESAKNKEIETISKYSDKLLGNLGNVPIKAVDKETDSVRKIVNKVISDKASSNIYQDIKAFNNAKNKDLYELSFLEAIQNREDLTGKKNRSKRLTEYKKYLDDPETYWKNI